MPTLRFAASAASLHIATIVANVVRDISSPFHERADSVDAVLRKSMRAAVRCFFALPPVDLLDLPFRPRAIPHRKNWTRDWWGRRGAGSNPSWV